MPPGVLDWVAGCGATDCSEFCGAAETGATAISASAVPAKKLNRMLNRALCTLRVLHLAKVPIVTPHGSVAMQYGTFPAKCCPRP
jgi:hypothetical protein